MALAPEATTTAEIDLPFQAQEDKKVSTIYLLHPPPLKSTPELLIFKLSTRKIKLQLLVRASARNLRTGQEAGSM